MDSKWMIVCAFFGVVAVLGIGGAIIYAIGRRLEKKRDIRFKNK